MVTPGGSGANAPAYVSAPFDALQEQAYQDGTSLFWDFTSFSPIVDSTTDACIVFINAFATEGDDRPSLYGELLCSKQDFAKLITWIQTSFPMGL